MGWSALAPAEYQDLHAQKALAASAAETEDRERRGRGQEELAAAAGNRRMNENDLRQCDEESLPEYLDRLKQIQADLPPPHAAVAATAVRMALRRANARLRAEHGRAKEIEPTTPLRLLRQAWDKAGAAERAEFLSDVGAGGAVQCLAHGDAARPTPVSCHVRGQGSPSSAHFIRRGPMSVIFSQTADAILGRHPDFRDGLVKALGALPGDCFIDGKVGRAAPDDRVVLLCRGRETITVPHDEFGDAATVRRIVERWSSPTPD